MNPCAYSSSLRHTEQRMQSPDLNTALLSFSNAIFIDHPQIGKIIFAVHAILHSLFGRLINQALLSLNYTSPSMSEWIGATSLSSNTMSVPDLCKNTE